MAKAKGSIPRCHWKPPFAIRVNGELWETLGLFEVRDSNDELIGEYGKLGAPAVCYALNKAYPLPRRKKVIRGKK